MENRCAQARWAKGLIGVVMAAGVLAAAGVSTAAPVVLRAALVWNATPKARLDAFVKPFEALHPDIKIEFEPWYNDHLDQLAVKAVGGAAQDIVWLANAAPLLAADQGLLLDLSPYIQADQWQSNLRDFHPPTVDLMRRHGGLYGLPMYTTIGTIFYNTQMVNDAGVTISDDWDWNSFAATIRRLTVTDSATGDVKVAGFQHIPAWTRFFVWPAEAGVDFSNPNVVPLDTPQAYEAVQFWQDLTTPGLVSWGGGGYRKRTAAMQLSGSWELAAVRNAKVPTGFAQVPTGPKGRVTLTNTDILSITSGTKHPKEAWEFLKWFYQTDTQRQFLQMFGLQPARLSLGLQWVQAQAGLVQNAGLAKWAGLDSFIKGTAFARPQPFFSDGSVIDDLIMPTLVKVITKHEPVASTLAAMSKEADAKLASASKK